MALINTVTGVRPDPKRYNDKSGSVIQKGKLGTKVARGKVLEYDGCINQTVTQLKPFRKWKRSPHQIREIVKGILVSRPELETADAQDIMRYVIVQLLGGEHSHNIAIKDIELLCDAIPFQKVLSAIRDMRNRDGDIEDLTGDAWWTHKKIKPGQPDKTKVAEYHRRGWLTRARTAAAVTGSANLLRTKMAPIAQTKTFELQCVKRKGGRPAGEVTDVDFDGVEASDV